MSWYKKASNYIETLKQVKKCLMKAYKLIGRGNWQDARVGGNPSFEFVDEADPRGTSYIQVYYNEHDNTIGFSKYYESEFMQDEYGKDLQIPFDPETCVESILSTVENLKSS